MTSQVMLRHGGVGGVEASAAIFTRSGWDRKFLTHASLVPNPAPEFLPADGFAGGPSPSCGRATQSAHDKRVTQGSGYHALGT